MLTETGSPAPGQHEERPLSDKALPMAITGGVAVIAIGMAMIFFMLHRVSTEVDEVRVEIDQLRASVEILPNLKEGASNMNARINELDSGLLAMAKMLKLDGAELSRLMNDELTGRPSLPAPVAIQAPAIQMKPRSAPAPAETPEAPAWAIASENSNGTDSLKTQAPLTIEDVDRVLVERISDNWTMPPGNIEDLRTELALSLERNGAIKSVEVITSSGNRIFDDSAVTAIKRINSIAEVALLTDDLYRAGYQSRSIVFTPDLGGS